VLNGNHFIGDVNLSSLPLRLKELKLHDNAFDGTLTIGSYVKQIKQFRIENNPLKEEISFVGNGHRDMEFEHELRKMAGLLSDVKL